MGHSTWKLICIMTAAPELVVALIRVVTTIADLARNAVSAAVDVAESGVAADEA